MEVCFRQRLIYPALIGSKRPATLEQQNNALERRPFGLDVGFAQRARSARHPRQRAFGPRRLALGLRRRIHLGIASRGKSVGHCEPPNSRRSLEPSHRTIGHAFRFQTINRGPTLETSPPITNNLPQDSRGPHSSCFRGSTRLQPPLGSGNLQPRKRTLVLLAFSTRCLFARSFAVRRLGGEEQIRDIRVRRSSGIAQVLIASRSVHARGLRSTHQGSPVVDKGGQS